LPPDWSSRNGCFVSRRTFRRGFPTDGPTHFVRIECT
jgi:hypothetical protein